MTDTLRDEIREAYGLDFFVALDGLKGHTAKTKAEMKVSAEERAAVMKSLKERRRG